MKGILETIIANRRQMNWIVVRIKINSPCENNSHEEAKRIHELFDLRIKNSHCERKYEKHPTF